MSMWGVFFQEENFPYVHGFPEFLLPNLCVRIWNAKLGSIEQGVKDILRTLHQRQFPHTCVQFSVVGDSVESIWRFPIHGGTPKSIKIMGPMGLQKLVTHALDILGVSSSWPSFWPSYGLHPSTWSMPKLTKHFQKPSVARNVLRVHPGWFTCLYCK